MNSTLLIFKIVIISDFSGVINIKRFKNTQQILPVGTLIFSAVPILDKKCSFTSFIANFVMILKISPTEYPSVSWTFTNTQKQIALRQLDILHLNLQDTIRYSQSSET